MRFGASPLTVTGGATCSGYALAALHGRESPHPFGPAVPEPYGHASSSRGEDWQLRAEKNGAGSDRHRVGNALAESEHRRQDGPGRGGPIYLVEQATKPQQQERENTTAERYGKKIKRQQVPPDPQSDRREQLDISAAQNTKPIREGAYAENKNAGTNVTDQFDVILPQDRDGQEQKG